MFKRKSECQKVRKMLSAYLDNCLNFAEQEVVKCHLEICEDCCRELDSLEATVHLLRHLPAAVVPRPFTLITAETGRKRAPSGAPSLNWLRVATAVAVILLAVLLAGDFTGLFYAEISPQAPGPAEVMSPAEGETLLILPEGEVSPPTPSRLLTPPIEEEGAAEVVTVPETQEATPPKPSTIPSEDKGIAEKVEGIAPGAGEVLSPTPPPNAPLVRVPETTEAIPSTSPSIAHREAYPWLRPLEIAFAALVVILGGITLLVWQRRWHLIGRGGKNE